VGEEGMMVLSDDPTTVDFGESGMVQTEQTEDRMTSLLLLEDREE
jgi:hypothetical protein